MEYNAQQICAKSRNRRTSVILQLLNSDYNVVDEIQGSTIDGTITIKNSVESNYSRRSGSIQLLLTKALSAQYYKIDLLHMVRILVIVKDVTTSLSATYDMGIFLLSNPQILQSVTEERITVNLLDIMANYDGTFGKSLPNLQSAMVKSGVNIASAITAIGLDMMGLTIDKMKIEPTPDLFTIEEVSTDPTSNVTDHIKSVLTYAINYDLYFDKSGILCFEYIKNRDNDLIYQEFINSDVVISYEVDEDFTNIRNVINVLGSMIQNSSIQVQATYKETNQNNPLNIYNIGERPLTISNDKLLNNDQCYAQAKYECTQRTNYKEKLIMSILPDYRLEPNKKIKIEYTSFTENLQINGYYLIDEISVDFKSDGLMTVTCHKLYPTT